MRLSVGGRASMLDNSSIQHRLITRLAQDWSGSDSAAATPLAERSAGFMFPPSVRIHTSLINFTESFRLSVACENEALCLIISTAPWIIHRRALARFSSRNINMLREARIEFDLANCINFLPNFEFHSFSVSASAAQFTSSSINTWKHPTNVTNHILFILFSFQLTVSQKQSTQLFLVEKLN